MVAFEGRKCHVFVVCGFLHISKKKNKVENKSKNKREKQAPEADERGNTLHLAAGEISA